MHSHDTKDQFVQLRAAGHSFGQISEQLGVAKSTLHHWEDERADDIARLRRLLWQEAEEEFGERIEDQLTQLVCRMKDCQHRLNQFRPDQYTLRDAFFILRESRREYFRLRALLMGTSKGGARTSQARPPKPMPTETAAPSTLQPFNPSTLTHAESNKTERFTQNGDTAPLITNDLQQPAAESFDFQPSGPPLPSSDATAQRFNDLTPPAAAPAHAVHDSPQRAHPPSFTPPHRPTPHSQLSTLNSRPGNNFSGSVVVSPLEGGQAIIRKCLKAEAASG